MTEAVQATDRSFPDNADLRIENGEPILRRPDKAAGPSGKLAIELLVAERLEPTNLLDVLRDTEHWLHWTRFFGPISGHDAKLDDPLTRYLTTTFCYGCQLGPSQAAQSLTNVAIFARRVEEKRCRSSPLSEPDKPVVPASGSSLVNAR